MDIFENVAYTIKVAIKKSSENDDEIIAKNNWYEFQNNAEIKTFTRRYIMNLKVCELRQSLCDSGFIPYNKQQTTLYISEGYGEPFQLIHEDINDNLKLLEIIPSVYNPVLLAIVKDDTNG
ncbi:MAG: hypothetical protein K6B70_02170 [Clostridia bacterium]|nr:hypothetical protein [Clostridia bacterium]